jgi:peptidoglycan L-alanyl-D-glutamate endopeptidase CwlK
MRLRDPLLLHPTFRLRVEELRQRLIRERIPLEIYETVRTPWRQAALYSRGRIDGSGRIATNAKAWESLHQYGLAVDFVFLLDGGRWVWDADRNKDPGLYARLRGWWGRYVDLAHSIGLTHATDIGLKETPHVQLDGWKIADCKRGLYPPTQAAPAGSNEWRAWLGDQIEKWGPYGRDEHGAFHPGAPPAMELDDRPVLTS